MIWVFQEVTITSKMRFKDFPKSPLYPEKSQQKLTGLKNYSFDENSEKKEQVKLILPDGTFYVGLTEEEVKLKAFSNKKTICGIGVFFLKKGRVGKRTVKFVGACIVMVEIVLNLNALKTVTGCQKFN